MCQKNVKYCAIYNIRPIQSAKTTEISLFTWLFGVFKYLFEWEVIRSVGLNFKDKMKKSNVFYFMKNVRKIKSLTTRFSL